MSHKILMQCSVILEVVVKGSCDTIGGDLMAERMSTVTSKEKGVGLDDGQAHAVVDEVGNVRVGSIPLGSKQACKALLAILGVLIREAIYQVQEQCEVSTECEAGLSVLVGLLLGCTL